MQQSPRRLKLNYDLSDHGVNALHWLAAYALSRPTRPGVNSSLLLRLVSYAPSIKRSGNPPPNPCLKTGLYFEPVRLVQTPPPPRDYHLFAYTQLITCPLGTISP